MPRGAYAKRYPAHYIVNGQPFVTARAVFQHAQRKFGYGGSLKTIRGRLRKGYETWPPLLQLSAAGRHPHQHGHVLTTEMVDLCAGIDARKREIKERERLAKEREIALAQAEA